MESYGDVKFSHKPAKILIIDDNESTGRLLKRRLSIYGHEVVSAVDYKTALDLLNEKSVDVIFLSMFIGHNSSYDFLMRLKENELFKGIPIIMISNDSDIELVVKCIEGGAEDYLVTPLNQTLLKARLANCIAKKESYDKEIAYIAKIEQGRKQIKEQEKMASVGVLISSISQELKSPLNFVINFAEVSSEICEELIRKIEDNKEKINPEIFDTLLSQIKSFQSNVSKIYSYGRNADKIIRFMHDQSNISGGKKHLANINKIIDQTIAMLFSHYKTNGITVLPKINMRFDNAVPHMEVSTQAFSKAIYNILDNSIDTVRSKFQDLSLANIYVSTENTPSEVIVTLYDNGLGIASDVKDKIFEPFFSTKSDGVHTGLSLSTAKEIIEDHHGFITLESIENEYTKFTIKINKTK